MLGEMKSTVKKKNEETNKSFFKKVKILENQLRSSTFFK